MRSSFESGRYIHAASVKGMYSYSEITPLTHTHTQSVHCAETLEDNYIFAV